MRLLGQMVADCLFFYLLKAILKTLVQFFPILTSRLMKIRKLQCGNILETHYINMCSYVRSRKTILNK